MYKRGLVIFFLFWSCFCYCSSPVLTLQTPLEEFREKVNNTVLPPEKLSTLSQELPYLTSDEVEDYFTLVSKKMVKRIVPKYFSCLLCKVKLKKLYDFKIHMLQRKTAKESEVFYKSIMQ